ncbi:DEAD/DEAH box helicase family protein [Candidatus Peribacteria bacterium]|nr:DEAD/DEAH box helicase family protein [Candidatus Peribacteria bacterium]
MLSLKPYQQRCIERLADFLKEARAEKDPNMAFYKSTHEKYNDLPGETKTPFVCIRVPTGGGKTLIASHAVSCAFEHYLLEKQESGIVLWLVPTDSIRTQTLRQLKDRTHPYRETIDHAFSSRVRVMDIVEARSIKPTDVTENLCIIVTTLASIRREDTEGLKVYAQNGALMDHFHDIPEGADIFRDDNGDMIQSLANVIRLHRPLVILDEGHNAQTELSMEVIGNFCPSCIVEFTATPLSESNILVTVPAIELKQEDMVKIPIHLENITQWQEAVHRAREKRDELEEIAKKEQKESNEYLRPILLLQAEVEQEREDKVHVHRLVDFLTSELHIPRTEIAIKTGREDELTQYDDLLNKRCPIRYIVTCNALKEGWDCSFAYVLVSASNMGTRLSVEQIIGRVLRLPYATRKQQEALNRSYVFTASRRFDDAARAVVQGLEQNGYSKHDVIHGDAADARTDYEAIRSVTKEHFLLPYLSIGGQPLDFYDLIPEEFSLQGKAVSTTILDDIENRASVIDIDSDDVTLAKQQQLKLLHLSEEETREQLILWVARSAREQAILMEDMMGFVTDIVSMLLKKLSLAELYARKFALRDSVTTLINDALIEEAEKNFHSLQSSKKIMPSIDEEAWHIPQKLTLLHPLQESFKLHLFDRCDDLNNEELDLARQLDTHPNTAWWLRNVVHGDDGFHVQGFRPRRFYPDFIVRTKNDVWWILEYKGADRLGSLDTTYKLNLGAIWADVCGKSHNFRLVGKDNLAEILEEIAQ